TNPLDRSGGIPTQRRERNPLITPAGWKNFRRIENNPHAPIWNYVVGDRLLAEDLPAIVSYRREIEDGSRPGEESPPESILAYIESMRSRVLLFRDHLPEGFNIARDWGEIPTMSREDLAVRIESVVPVDADLSRLIVYDTSGTTGHALRIPQHPGAVALNHPLLDHVLGQYKALPEYGPHMTACFNVGSEGHTVVFPNVFTAWREAGFAKINIHPNSWRQVTDNQRFFDAMDPAFLTGDPLAFDEMVKWEIATEPAAMVSTAVALSAGLRQRLESRYGCPVIDFYSTTETGPIAYAAPDGDGLLVLPPDIYVEIVDEDGYPVPLGQRGEITVSGGRNPFVPLLRYRTGDYGRLGFSRQRGADPGLRIYDLEARSPARFRATDGSSVHPVDIGREMRTATFVQHEFVQRADGSLDISIRPAAGARADTAVIVQAIRSLFGRDQEVRVRIDETLGERMKGGKTVPYRCEIMDGQNTP
ncbi:MAG: AMP-binding protein, partial [Gammaproteobacteria bacterium]|nr:AMP-binding protein [Gammaproteobacteria bacterium]